MKRFVLAVALTFAFAPTTLLAEGETPKKDEKTAQADGSVRKLSRRERKDRIAKLAERHRQFLTEVEPIILVEETDAFLVLETDAQRDGFVEDFWRRRDRAQGTSNRAFRDRYYARIEEVRERFESFAADRSRMYLIHGEPAETLNIDCKYLQPLQIWTYLNIPGLGSRVRFLFYVPRNGREYKLWIPMFGSGGTDSLAELVSMDVAGLTVGSRDAIEKAFSNDPLFNVSRIQLECKDGDAIFAAISQSQMNRTQLTNVFTPPPVDPEGATKLVNAAVIATPNAPQLTGTEFSIRYPGRDGSRTDAEITVQVPRAQMTAKDVGGAQMYSIDVVGEVLRDEQMWERFRYRFDIPADIQDERLPIVMNRLLRPQAYKTRLKIVDAHSGAETILEKAIDVPQIFDTAEQVAAKSAADATLAQIKSESAGTAKLRIVPMSEDVLSGIQTIETIATGDAIKAVEFWLDGKKIAVRRTPPFSLDLDFGIVPQLRRIRAVALNDKNEPITGDDIVVNTGTDPFRVRITSPRIAPNLKGRTRVEIDVKVPDGKDLGGVELYWNETKVATMYDAPFVHTVDIPAANGGVGYLRAVARLKDEAMAPIEDVVMINSPAYMEEVNVHLIELPTVVLAGGKPINTLQQSSFKVLDEGKPVPIAKFEHVKNLPLSIGLAVDTSGSMQFKMEETQKAGAQFLQNVMRKGDKAFLVAFDSQPQLVQKWSPKVGDIHAGLAKLRAEDYTALYDAVVYSLYNFLGVRGQKALVLLSDGKDTSSKFSFDQAIEYARRTAVPIYTIGIGIRSTELDVRLKLSRLASETGGNVYYIERASELMRIYDDIQNELRSQYVIGFYPPETVKAGGKWREVTVQTSEGKAKTIRGYYP
jgi:Ca-activated chloride channel family protein